MEDGTERKEEPGDGEEWCETLTSGHDMNSLQSQFPAQDQGSQDLSGQC